jgi:uncharacterized protein with GYD domain
MVTYVSLFKWTEQGVTKIADTVKRAEDFAAMAEKAGGRVKHQYWTVGDYDGVLVFEAPDDVTAIGLLAKLAKAGNVKTQTLRAFEAGEMKQILAKAK